MVPTISNIVIIVIIRSLLGPQPLWRVQYSFQPLLHHKSSRPGIYEMTPLRPDPWQNLFVRLVLDMQLQVWHPTMGNKSHPTARSKHRYTVICFNELDTFLVSKLAKSNVFSYVRLNPAYRLYYTDSARQGGSHQVIKFMLCLQFCIFQ